MKIKRLVIENFKSIERIELIEPNPFTVFVGPNGSGKSNIFEALEFANALGKNSFGNTVRLFGGASSVINRKTKANFFEFSLDFKITDSPEYLVHLVYLEDESGVQLSGGYKRVPSEQPTDIIDNTNIDLLKFYNKFYFNFSRIFINKSNLQRFPFQDSKSLNLSTNNLEKVLKRLLDNETLREEIDDWLSLFIPGFENITIHSEIVSGNDSILLKDKHIEKPFDKSLISDGTYNIIALLTAIYQSDEPQFLCIEEPENGLNPKVVRELVNLCRYACEEKGHFIWLNTHSQTLVSQLTPDEIILVDKKQGATETKQIKGMNLHGLPMDEAWLSKVLGGGLPW